jgi:hypothetical protein
VAKRGANKTETGITEQEFERQARQEAIDALRQFKVTFMAGREERQSVVFAHFFAISTRGAVMFLVHTTDGAYTRRAFLNWIDIEEILAPEHSRSESHNN